MIVFSVPFTGTRFTTNLLTGASLRYIHDHTLIRENRRKVEGRNVFNYPGCKAVIPVRHPYDVLEGYWQRNGHWFVQNCLEHYEDLLNNIDTWDYTTLRVMKKTEDNLQDRLDEFTKVANHLGMDTLPPKWEVLATRWENHWHTAYRKEPYPGDKSIVDFAVEHFGFETE